jgi:formate hydrogenlyase subunit 3/multisubunit Na+/H+ antiporter MnhD subunit
LYYDPPYFLLIAGLLVGITSGIAFEATLKQSAQEWSRNRSTRTIANLKGVSLRLPFLGICSGVCVFLASGVAIFGFPAKVGYAIALPMTILIGGLVWVQLGSVLRQLEEGGSQAIDLDDIR